MQLNGSRSQRHSRERVVAVVLWKQQWRRRWWRAALWPSRLSLAPINHKTASCCSISQHSDQNRTAAWLCLLWAAYPAATECSVHRGQTLIGSPSSTASCFTTCGEPQMWPILTNGTAKWEEREKKKHFSQGKKKNTPISALLPLRKSWQYREYIYANFVSSMLFTWELWEQLLALVDWLCQAWANYFYLEPTRWT